MGRRRLLRVRLVGQPQSLQGNERVASGADQPNVQILLRWCCVAVFLQSFELLTFTECIWNRDGQAGVSVGSRLQELLGHIQDLIMHHAVIPHR